MILLKDRLRCRSDGQVTVGSKVSWGPMQLRETFSVPSEGRDSSSTGSNCSWLFCRSSRVRLFKFYIELKNKLKKKKTQTFLWNLPSNHFLVIRHIADAAPDREPTETPADCCGSGPGGEGVQAAAGHSGHPSDRTECPTRYLTGPTDGSFPALWAEKNSHQVQTLRRRHVIRSDPFSTKLVLALVVLVCIPTTASKQDLSNMLLTMFARDCKCLHPRKSLRTQYRSFVR